MRILTAVSGALGALAGRATRHVRVVPGVAAAGCLVVAGALVTPALGWAVAGAVLLALDWRLR